MNFRVRFGLVRRVVRVVLFKVSRSSLLWSFRAEVPKVLLLGSRDNKSLTMKLARSSRRRRRGGSSDGRSG